MNYYNLKDFYDDFGILKDKYIKLSTVINNNFINLELKYKADLKAQLDLIKKYENIIYKNNYIYNKNDLFKIQLNKEYFFFSNEEIKENKEVNNVIIKNKLNDIIFLKLKSLIYENNLQNIRYFLTKKEINLDMNDLYRYIIENISEDCRNMEDKDIKYIFNHNNLGNIIENDNVNNKIKILKTKFELIRHNINSFNIINEIIKIKENYYNKYKNLEKKVEENLIKLRDKNTFDIIIDKRNFLNLREIIIQEKKKSICDKLFINKFEEYIKYIELLKKYENKLKETNNINVELKKKKKKEKKKIIN